MPSLRADKQLGGCRVGRRGVGAFQRGGRAVLDARPFELAAHASLCIDGKRAGETLRIDATAAFERRSDAERVVSECEEPTATRTGFSERLASGLAHFARQPRVA